MTPPLTANSTIPMPTALLPCQLHPVAYAIFLALLAAVGCGKDEDLKHGVAGSLGVFTIDGHAYETYLHANTSENRTKDYISFGSTTVGPDFNGERVPPLPPRS